MRGCSVHPFEVGSDQPLLVTSILGGAPGLKASTLGEIGLECASKLVRLRYLQCDHFFSCFSSAFFHA